MGGRLPDAWSGFIARTLTSVEPPSPFEGDEEEGDAKRCCKKVEKPPMEPKYNVPEEEPCSEADSYQRTCDQSECNELGFLGMDGGMASACVQDCCPNLSGGETCNLPCYLLMLA